jgi:hypothetical protein
VLPERVGTSFTGTRQQHTLGRCHGNVVVILGMAR